jgi:hypothetical protein
MSRNPSVDEFKQITDALDAAITEEYHDGFQYRRGQPMPEAVCEAVQATIDRVIQLRDKPRPSGRG